MARLDERPINYGYSNDNELLDRDRERVDELNAISERRGWTKNRPVAYCTRFSLKNQPLLAIATIRPDQ